MQHVFWLSKVRSHPGLAAEFPERCDMPLAGSVETGEFGSCPRANGNKTSVLPLHKSAPEMIYRIVKMLLYPFNCPVERRLAKAV